MTGQHGPPGKINLPLCGWNVCKFAWRSRSRGNRVRNSAINDASGEAFFLVPFQSTRQLKNELAKENCLPRLRETCYFGCVCSRCSFGFEKVKFTVWILTGTDEVSLSAKYFQLTRQLKNEQRTRGSLCFNVWYFPKQLPRSFEKVFMPQISWNCLLFKYTPWTFWTEKVARVPIIKKFHK